MMVAGSASGLPQALFSKEPGLRYYYFSCVLLYFKNNKMQGAQEGLDAQCLLLLILLQSNYNLSNDLVQT